MFNTPVLFLVFNRPDLTEIVFKKIQEAKPKYLYVAADGPRKDKDDEDNVCQRTREVVVNNIDWDCELKTLFRNKNLGCGRAVSEAIDWFFSQVDEGIILEDDCLADSSFFEYCRYALNEFRSNSNIWHIGGNYFLNNSTPANEICLSKFPFIWGWATWKVAWNNYNLGIQDTDLEISNVLKNNFTREKHVVDFWLKRLLAIKRMEVPNTWDYQWFYTIWKNNGWAIMPKVNLVSNIGFGAHATHTIEQDHYLSNRGVRSIEIPFSPIKKYKRGGEMDNETFRVFYMPNFKKKSLLLQIKMRIHYLLIGIKNYVKQVA